MRIAKAIASAVGTAATIVTAALADDVLALDEQGAIVSAVVVGALSVWAVWRVPNAVEPGTGRR